MRVRPQQTHVIHREVVEIGGTKRERLRLECGHVIIRALRPTNTRRCICPFCDTDG